MATRGPLVCVCGHVKGWHFRGNIAGRCTISRCTCRSFDQLRIARRAKFGNHKTRIEEWPGVLFDSKGEAGRARALLMLEASGQIVGLRVHPRYPLFVEKRLVGTYVPDFDYTEKRTGELIVEDVKSPPTAALATFKIKRRLMLACYGIDVRVVWASEYR